MVLYLYSERIANESTPGSVWYLPDLSFNLDLVKNVNRKIIFSSGLQNPVY